MVPDLSTAGMIAAIEAEIDAFPLQPGEVRYVVLIDKSGREEDVEMRAFHRRLLAGERFDHREVRVAS